MIRRTLAATQRATFSVDLPDHNSHGMPRPVGSGFFVSPDGWFLTAAHVVTKDLTRIGPVRGDVDQCRLMKEVRPGEFGAAMCQFVKLEKVFPERDVAILKVDFERNANKVHLKGLDGFPHLLISRRRLDEGEPVYAFGYPLQTSGIVQNAGGVIIGKVEHAPRTTSAIVAATMYSTPMVSSGTEPQVYVLDKAFNYGNSGGPIVATETGRVHALCYGFQPVEIVQAVVLKGGQPLSIDVPSLYGLSSSLNDPFFIPELERLGIPLTDE